MNRKRVKVPMSRARSDFFRLADLVRDAQDETVVVLESRGGREPLALVREARLAYLEDQVAQMNTQMDRPFTLSGSLAATVDDDSLTSSLQELRRAWAQTGADDVVAASKAPRSSPKRSRRP